MSEFASAVDLKINDQMKHASYVAVAIALVHCFQPLFAVELFKEIGPPDGGLSDLFGGAVSVYEDTALIGSRFNDEHGSAYLFDLPTGNKISKLSNPNRRFF